MLNADLPLTPILGVYVGHVIVPPLAPRALFILRVAEHQEARIVRDAA